MLTLDQLALQPKDRALLVGTTRAGKSTLARFLLSMWQDTHCLTPKLSGRLLIADTKPRWRGTIALTGQSVRTRYRDYVTGDTIRGVILSSPKDWELAWDKRLNPYQTVILQSPKLNEDAHVRFQVSQIARYFETQKAGMQSLLYVDEGMDFYGPTGNARYGNAIQRCFRAGAEKGMASLLGIQRPKTVNLQTLTEANVLYLFMLRFEADIKRLQEMGYPPKETCPDTEHVFRYMRNGRLYPNLLTLPAKVAA
jgi:hypothetical protein